MNHFTNAAYLKMIVGTSLSSLIFLWIDQICTRSCMHQKTELIDSALASYFHVHVANLNVFKPKSQENYLQVIINIIILRCDIV